MSTVSVIIPTKDRAAELVETLASVRAQTYGDWEALVVDDASIEDIDAVVRAAGDARIRRVRLPAGRTGSASARNFGVERSTGEFVLFLDSDDALAPECLLNRVALMRQRPELDFAVWSCSQFRERPGDLPLLWNVLEKPGDDDLDRFLRRDLPWQTSSPLWRRSALAKVGPWDELALSGQDWEFHVRALSAGLRYEKRSVVDHHWRVAASQRQSIGKSAAMDKRHPRAWAATVERVYERLAQAGRLDAKVRLRFAVNFWDAAERLSSRVSQAEARQLWSRTRQRGLISRRQWAQGLAYFTAGRFPALARRVRQRLAERWPAPYFTPENGTFAKVRRPGTSPSVSVLISAYNAEAYVEEAVASICRQTLRDFEVLIIDDGSQDRTLPVLRRLAAGDCRIRLFERPHQGIVRQNNFALGEARGEFIARMDADDIALPDRLEMQVDFLRRHPEVVALGTQRIDIDPYGIELESPVVPTDHEQINAQLLHGNGGTILQSSAVIRAAAMRQVGGYRPQFECTEDLDLWLRLAEVGRLANLPEALAKYRHSPRGVTYTRRNEQLRVKAQIVREAYERRGLAPPQPLDLDNWRPQPPETLRHLWGWRALRHSRPDAAVGHALALLGLRPLSPDSWRLLYCAVRGR